MKTNPPTEKEILIEAFKSLDFKTLRELLDSNRSYMNVSKELFLSTLQQKIAEHSELKSYENVVEGICNYCNIGCKAYKFTTKNAPSLSLFFEEKNDEVTDIYICNVLNLEIPDGNDWEINFSFYPEDNENFKPSEEHLQTLKKVESAVLEFENLATLGLVPIEAVINWHTNMQDLANELNLNSFFAKVQYKAFEHIEALYDKVSRLVLNYKKNHLAITALKSYSKIDPTDEIKIARWVKRNKKIRFLPLKNTENWKNTGILILETEPNLVVDCTGYLDGYIFDEIYKNHTNASMKK